MSNPQIVLEKQNERMLRYLFSIENKKWCRKEKEREQNDNSMSCYTERERERDLKDTVLPLGDSHAIQEELFHVAHALRVCPMYFTSMKQICKECCL